MGGMAEPGSDDGYWANAGWIAAGLIIAAVFTAGGIVWFIFHPL